MEDVMADFAEGKKIRRAGVKLIPKFKIAPPRRTGIYRRRG